MTKLLLLALAGSAGTLARYGLSELVKRTTLSVMPWSTWSVNILGSFLFGLVWVLAEERGLFAEEVRLILLVGFMGAFTTFSSYIFDCAGLWQGGHTTAFFMNILGQNIVGIAVLMMGMGIGRYINRLV